jgi:hypothetical protein
MTVILHVDCSGDTVYQDFILLLCKKCTSWLYTMHNMLTVRTKFDCDLSNIIWSVFPDNDPFTASNMWEFSVFWFNINIGFLVEFVIDTKNCFMGSSREDSL